MVAVLKILKDFFATTSSFNQKLLIVSYLFSYFVIPAKAGIQKLFKLVPGFCREDD